MDLYYVINPSILCNVQGSSFQVMIQIKINPSCKVQHNFPHLDQSTLEFKLVIPSTIHVFLFNCEENFMGLINIIKFKILPNRFKLSTTQIVLQVHRVEMPHIRFKSHLYCEVIWNNKLCFNRFSPLQIQVTKNPKQ